jgi:hypothetical protein
MGAVSAQSHTRTGCWKDLELEEGWVPPRHHHDFHSRSERRDWIPNRPGPIYRKTREGVIALLHVNASRCPTDLAIGVNSQCTYSSSHSSTNSLRSKSVWTINAPSSSSRFRRFVVRYDQAISPLSSKHFARTKASTGVPFASSGCTSSTRSTSAMGTRTSSSLDIGQASHSGPSRPWFPSR